MASVNEEKTTFNNWVKKLYDGLRKSATKLVKLLIPGYTSNQSQGGSSTNAEDKATPEKPDLNESYLNEVIEIAKLESRNLLRKQASGTNVSEGEIIINWWLEDNNSYWDIKNMIGGNKIDLPSSHGDPSIMIVFRPRWHWDQLKTAALRYLDPNLPKENHRSHDVTLKQLTEDKDTFGKFHPRQDLLNNNLFYSTSKQIVDDYIDCKEIVPFSQEVYPAYVRKKVRRLDILYRSYKSAAKSKLKSTDTREIFPNHKIFKQIDVLFQDSDGLNLDMIMETDKRFSKISDSNKSLFFCGQCGIYFELSEIPSWPDEFPTPDSRDPSKNYQSHSGGEFERIVSRQKCPNGHSHPFIMRNELNSSLDSVSSWFNWQYSLEKYNVTPLEKKFFNYNLIIDGNFESQIKMPPTEVNPLDYANWDVKVVVLFQEMYRPILPLTHVHNKKCITQMAWFRDSILSLKNDWKASNFQFVIDKMNDKNSTAIDIIPEDYPKISYNPRQKCNFNWHELGIGIYEGKGENPKQKCQCEDERHAGKPSHKHWKLDTNKHKFVCKYCGENYPVKSIVPYSKPRDINQPIKIKHIMLGNE